MRDPRRWRAFAVSVFLLGAACFAGGDAEAPVGAQRDVGLLACQVTDEAGVDDGGFNQMAHEGLERARVELGAEIDFLESEDPRDYRPNIEALVSRGCDLVVPVTLSLAEATWTVADQNPDRSFAIMDFEADPPLRNVRSLTFETEQAAFLAGYVAAATSTTGSVATFGSLNLPSVTQLMDGFVKGVEYHNRERGTDVAVLGWNPERQSGVFAHNTRPTGGRRVARRLIESGADVLMPAMGAAQAVGLGAAQAAEEAGGVRLIWTGADGCVSSPAHCELIITSVVPNVDVAIFETVESVARGTFRGGTYVGTLRNAGVGIEPFPAVRASVPGELREALGEIRRGVVDGTIPGAIPG